MKYKQRNKETNNENKEKSPEGSTLTFEALVCEMYDYLLCIQTKRVKVNQIYEGQIFHSQGCRDHRTSRTFYY